MTLKNRITRIDPDFSEILKNIKLQRIKNRIDIKFRSDRELTKMMMKCPSFPKVKQELARIPTKTDFKKLMEDDFL